MTKSNNKCRKCNGRGFILLPLEATTYTSGYLGSEEVPRTKKCDKCNGEAFKCDHIIGDGNYGHSLMTKSNKASVYYEFDYCPKCGEKLNE